MFLVMLLMIFYLKAFPLENVTQFIINDIKKEETIKLLSQLVDRKNKAISIPVEVEITSLKHI